MIRVHFTAGDLARTRVGATLGPLPEAVFSLSALRERRRPPLLTDWAPPASIGVADVRQMFGLLSRGHEFDMVSIIGTTSDIASGVEAVRATPHRLYGVELAFTAARHGRPPGWATTLADRDGSGRRWLARTLGLYGSEAIDPYWPRIRSALDAERQRLVRILAAGGVEALLSSLHPSIVWRPPCLVIDTGREPRDTLLDGLGLTIVPSLFCPVGYPVTALVDGPEPEHRLIYPIRPRGAGLPGGGGHESDLARRLGTLLGVTRARVLAAIGDGPCSTTELATRSATSLATASEHASVLRGAGLVVTHRRGNTVRHELTALGSGLLRYGGVGS